MLSLRASGLAHGQPHLPAGHIALWFVPVLCYSGFAQNRWRLHTGASFSIGISNETLVVGGPLELMKELR